MTDDSIHFILTGGTIDSFYDGTKDTVVPNKHSIIPQLINSLKLYNKSLFTEVCMKDSRGLDQNDRNELLKAIEESPNQKIIITHGTYTMPDTARFLKANLKRNDQVIILTGSLIPIKGFSPSDGTLNLGYAIAQLENLKPGVYVCMNCKVFNPEEVLKIISEGRFASIFNK
ncbi:MAG: asparaginase domain-containing protein [bacterium]|nr:asparaginase domain-containing protein [bacterium]